jgi:magnesium transporter
MILNPANIMIIRRLLSGRQSRPLRSILDRIAPADLATLFVVLSFQEKRQLVEVLMSIDKATETLVGVPQHQLEEFLTGFETNKFVSLVTYGTEDQAAYLLSVLPEEKRSAILALLESAKFKRLTQLLNYPEDSAGRNMETEVFTIPWSLTSQDAIDYLRKKAPEQNLYYVYCVDDQNRLYGVLSLRALTTAAAETPLKELARTDVVTVSPETPKAEVAKLVSHYDLIAIPVVDADKKLLGLVTVDDVVDMIQEEATEDIQKLGGTEALDEPYLSISMGKLVRKRASWLVILFLGELFTATAMGYYEKEIERAVVLALFIPLIISSGGNSGSQATSLVIRALALQELKLADWGRVLLRELKTGLFLGLILGAIGMMRILLWPSRNVLYGEHYLLVAVTVAGSLLGVVLWGCISGSMLPFALRKVGLDPATASAPFVATLVDVTGLVIYFTVANFILRGTLL